VAAITEANRKWWICGTMTLALSMILIDQTVVSVALPSIQRDLDTSQTALQWVVNAYLLAIAAFVAVGGRVADILGTDRIFKLGAGVFVAASAACGLADSEATLLVARAVEGLGAALMIPATGAIVINAFEPRERGRAMGVYAGVSMVFLALGPLLGGILTQDVSWRAVFWINVPIGVVMLVLAHLTVPRAPRVPGARLDWVGTLLLVPALTALVLALMQSQEWGWGSLAIIALFAAAAVLLLAFVLVEPHIRHALIELRLFRSRNFSGDGFVLFCIEFALIGLTVFGALWVQNVLAFTPIEAGLSLLPLTLPLLVLAPLVGRLYDKVGPRALVGGGCALVAAALAWSAAVLHQVSYGSLIPAYVAMGVGIGMIMSPANTDSLNSAPPAERGEASGVIQTLRQVGGAVGLAVMGTVVANVQQSHIDAFVASDPKAGPGQAAEIERVLSESAGAQAAAREHISPNVVSAAHDALTAATSTSYYVAAGVMGFTAVVAVAVLRHVRAADAPPPEHPPTLPAPRGAVVGSPRA
jgi:EmrB/QacA subfamily drug resistance transporter